MKTQAILLLAVFVFSVASTGLWFDYGLARFEKRGDWNVFSFPCVGGSGNYKWSFDYLPKGWKSQGNKIYCPRDYDYSRYYGIRVGVTDSIYGDSIRKSVICNLGQSRVQDIFDVDYGYKFETSSLWDKLISNRRVSLSSGSDGSLFIVTNRSGSSSGSSSGYEFPSVSVIDSNIRQGNVVWLSRTIVGIIEDSRVNCREAANFLSRLLSRIEAQITLYDDDATEVRKQIYLLQQEISFIRNQIAQLKSQSIDLPALRAKLAGLQRSLGSANNGLSQYIGQIKQINDDVQGYQSQIFSIKTSVIRRAQVEYNTAVSEINNIDGTIRQLEQRISSLRGDRAAQIRVRDNAQDRITKAQSDIDRLNERIKGAQVQTRTLQAKVTQAQSSIRVLTSQINEVKSQIAAGNFKVEGQISRLELKIQQNNKQIAVLTGKADTLDGYLVSLKGKVSDYQSQIKKHHSSCYLSSRKSVSVSSDPFIGYIKQIFGIAPTTTSSVKYFNSGYITPVSVFSPSWVRVYGLPYSSGYADTNDYMTSQFSCSYDPNDGDVFRGTIRSIKKNIVNVDDFGGSNFNVHLGGCTRLETLTGYEIPRVGDEIYWKGQSRKGAPKGHYNAYVASCY